MMNYYELGTNITGEYNEITNKFNYESCNIVNTNSSIQSKSSIIESDLLNELKKDLIFQIEELPELKIFKKLIDKFKKTQDIFLKSNIEFKKEYKKTEDDLKLVKSNAEYIKSVYKKYANQDELEENTKKFIEQVDNISKDIKDNNKLKEKRQVYENNRKEMLQYLHFIQTINSMNLGTTCSLCMHKNVDSYFDPCGHTMCKDCINKMDISLNSNDSNCPFCKNIVKMIKPLYFI